jgi:hypothetical protein
MKRMICMAAASLILLGASIAAAQSLGDYARAARKAKPQAASTSHHYDNDNLPRNQQLSVVGPEASVNTDNPQTPATATAPESANVPETANAPRDAAQTSAKDPKAEAADRQKAEEALQKKIDEKKQKIDALNHELDLSQREYKLRAAAMYSDAGNRLRNAAMWDKEDSQYKQEIAEKQKAIDSTQQELENAQEEARKAGLKQKDQE